MLHSVYRVTEVIGVSSDSWEAAARHAVETAAKSVRDLRVAEVVRQDVKIENGKGRHLPRPPRTLLQVRDGRLRRSGEPSHDPVIGG
jgi:flavin-binding protein dodecin